MTKEDQQEAPLAENLGNTVIKRPGRTLSEIVVFEVTADELESLEGNLTSSGISITFASASFGALVSLGATLLSLSYEKDFQKWVVFLVLTILSGVFFVWFAIAAYRSSNAVTRFMKKIREVPKPD